jgi:hypothetical protein
MFEGQGYQQDTLLLAQVCSIQHQVDFSVWPTLQQLLH